MRPNFETKNICSILLIVLNLNLKLNLLFFVMVFSRSLWHVGYLFGICYLFLNVFPISLLSNNTLFHIIHVCFIYKRRWCSSFIPSFDTFYSVIKQTSVTMVTQYKPYKTAIVVYCCIGYLLFFRLLFWT